MSSLDQMFAELGDTLLDLPIAFDWENFSNYQDYEISFICEKHPDDHHPGVLYVQLVITGRWHILCQSSL